MSVVALLITCLGLTLGMALLAIGLWGRRRGSDWHCRGCGYNLTGLPDQWGDCPECGADVTPSRSRVRGRRVRYPRLAVVGFVLILVVSAPFTIRLFGVSYYPYLPDALLTNLLLVEPARREVIARLIAGKLGGSSAQVSVDKALAIQGDVTKPWHDTWGLIIEEAGNKGLLSSTQILRYAEQAGLLRSTDPPCRSAWA